ncbi:hypothetical protein [Bifidobacterium simiarum]|uniref:hypothetical protein n=1 Tax=Bifidobacterium simiarum TaxID=2045441 RepID=UPI001BDDAC13|nr:hypothetical protein [Bifidobacterium simiarum]MBT1166732.1 hypothetical protein [Bifidobacterium simiarum]
MTDSDSDDSLRKLLCEYSLRFHEPYLHAGETAPATVEEAIKDISHWLEIGKPRPWADYPDGCLV